MGCAKAARFEEAIMDHLLKGNLSGYLSPKSKEPIANAKLRFYRTEKPHGKSEIKPKLVFKMLTEEMVEKDKKLLIGETQTNQKGEFTVRLGEGKSYDGKSVRIDLCPGKVPGQKVAKEKSVANQFTIAVIKPRWHKTNEGLAANWRCHLPFRVWCNVRLFNDAWVITGRVLNQGTNTPVSGVTVRAFDADRGSQYDSLGQGPTNSQGRFRIDYSSKDFVDYSSIGEFLEDSYFPFRAGPDLFFQVETVGGTVLLREPIERGRQPDRENAGHAFHVDLHVTESGELYVAGCSGVTIVDMASNTVVDTIAIAGNPREVAFTPDGAFAYVANDSVNDISVINRAMRSLDSTISVGGPSRSLAMAPNGTFCYASGANNLWVIDTATKRVSNTIPLDDDYGVPWDVVITPDGAKVYVTLYPDFIAVINTATNTVADYINPGEEIQDLAISADGTRLYVADQYGGVGIIDTATDQVIDGFFTDEPALYGIGITPDGTRAYIEGYDNILVIDLTTKEVFATLPFGALHSQGDVEVTAGGTCAYVSSSSGLLVIDTAANLIIDTLTGVVGDITIAPNI